MSTRNFIEPPYPGSATPTADFIEPPVPVRVLEALRAVLVDLRALADSDPKSELLRSALDLAQRSEATLAEYAATTGAATTTET